jgi:hypothetical protein
MPGMLTLAQIQAADVNRDVAKEKRLADILDLKKSVEQKATTLFSAYLTIALALFGVGGTLLKAPVANVPHWPFFLAGFAVALGACMFIWSIWPMTYPFSCRHMLLIRAGRPRASLTIHPFWLSSGHR